MTYVAFAPTKARRDNPEPFGTIAVDDGPNRHWDVDLDHLMSANPDQTIVLDEELDTALIAALRKTKGMSEVKDYDVVAGRTRTLPASLEDMNEAQLLSTDAGNEISEKLTDPANPLDEDGMRAEVQEQAAKDPEERRRDADATMVDKYEPETGTLNPDAQAGDGDQKMGPTDVKEDKAVRSDGGK